MAPLLSHRVGCSVALLPAVSIHVCNNLKQKLFFFVFCIKFRNANLSSVGTRTDILHTEGMIWLEI